MKDKFKTLKELVWDYTPFTVSRIKDLKYEAIRQAKYNFDCAEKIKNKEEGWERLDGGNSFAYVCIATWIMWFFNLKNSDLK